MNELGRVTVYLDEKAKREGEGGEKAGGVEECW